MGPRGEWPDSPPWYVQTDAWPVLQWPRQPPAHTSRALVPVRMLALVYCGMDADEAEQQRRAGNAFARVEVSEESQTRARRQADAMTDLLMLREEDYKDHFTTNQLLRKQFRVRAPSSIHTHAHAYKDTHKHTHAHNDTHRETETVPWPAVHTDGRERALGVCGV
jgi:ABC-type nickel/cobalt efflux system permease component RcnA